MFSKDVKEVVFIGCSDEQVKFGCCSDPRAVLMVGNTYELT